MKFEFAPTEGSQVAQAEALQSIANQLERIAVTIEDDDAPVLPDGGTDPIDRGANPEIGKATHVGTALGDDARDVGVGDLTLFQLEMLYVLADGPQHGLGIKDDLEDRYEDVNHGRLYPNLEDLAEKGLVDKREQKRDRRTNEYALTKRGQEFVRVDANRRGRVVQRMTGSAGGGA